MPPTRYTPEDIAAAKLHNEQRHTYARHTRGMCAYRGDLIKSAGQCHQGIRCTYQCDHVNDEKRVQHPTCIPLTTFLPSEMGGCIHWSNHLEPDQISLKEKQETTQEVSTVAPVPPSNRVVLADGLGPKFDQSSTKYVTPPKGLVWSYGVTTVSKRRNTLLPITLISLRKGGFPTPHLFVDGCTRGESWSDEFGLDVTCRGGSPVRVAGNWILSLYELYYRNPLADRYALFQDDLITYVGLREYLDGWFPERGYLNLYTMKNNVTYFAPHDEKGNPAVGWYKSNQWGKGAVALVFSREGVIELLCSRHMAKRPSNREAKGSEDRWYRSIDGGISSAMSGSSYENPRENGGAGYLEYVHYPTLVQHTGTESSREEQEGKPPQPTGQGFKGEGWDVRQLGMPKLAEGKIPPMPSHMVRIKNVVRDM